MFTEVVPSAEAGHAAPHKRVYTSGNAVSVKSNGTHLFVYDIHAGLHILKRDTANNPEITATIPVRIQDFMVVDDRLFVLVDFTGLQVYTISDPSQPRLVETVALPGIPDRISGGTTSIYVSTTGIESDSAVHKLSIASKGKPVVVDTIKIEGTVTALVDSGAYLTCSSDTSGLIFIDKSSFSISGKEPEFDIKEICGGAKYLGIIQGINNLVLYGSNRGSTLTAVSRKTTPVPSLALTGAGDYLYIHAGNFGLVPVSIADPYSITFKTAFNTGGSSQAGAVQGDTIYIADAQKGLVSADISNPAKPVLQGTISTSGLVHGFAVNGSTCYTIDYASGITQLDISSPGNPRILHSHRLQEKPLAIHVNKEHLYISTDGEELHSYRIESNGELTYLDSVVTYDQVTGIGHSKNRLFASGKIKTHIIDTSDPERLELIGSGPHSTSVADSGQYILLTGKNGLTVTKPGSKNLETIKEIATTGPLNMILVKGDIAWCGGYGTIFTLSLDNPEDPDIVATTEASGDIKSLSLEGTRLYAAAANSGVHEFQVHTDNSLSLKSSKKTTGVSWQAQPVKQFLYVADYNGGLVIHTR
jgi:hypothetical protein